MKKWTLILFGLFSSHLHAITLDDIQQQLGAHPIVRAEFEQKRSISGVSKPILSSGTIIVSQQDGLWWHQTKPFDLTLLLTNQVMKQSTAGNQPQVITAKQNPQLFQFNSLLSSLFKADKKTLEQNFVIKLQEKQTGWVITLTPKKEPLNKIFNTITLSGKQVLENIQVHDKQADQTNIRFFNHKLTPTTLQANERAYFK
ncbi:LolA family protein [Neisseria sp. Ec49-e6-T10]|uniref:LolA family protein n=1 Tax=Neisseria sp. Ec49-e6-T10 TaxID=3140744 RepID=UPI003EBCB8F5